MSGRTLRTLRAAYLFPSLVLVAAAIATHFLGQAVLELLSITFLLVVCSNDG